MGILENKKVHIRTFGCQMNVFDSAAAADMLMKEGCCPADGPDDADIVIYVTCSVRGHAENRVFSHIGNVQKIQKRRNGLPRIGIMGCTAERLGNAYPERFPGIDFVIGTRHIDQIVPAAEKAVTGQGPVVKTGLDRTGLLDYIPSVSSQPFSAYVPVSRGCSRRCSYCIVPFVRGNMVSRKRASVINDIRTHADRGCVEIVLLGQNIDAYGSDRGEKGAFSRLLEEAAGVPGLKRIKFITSHPADFSKDILRVIEDNPVICPFFHLPPQSGSNSILKKMGRGYTREYYLDLAETIYSRIPRASIAGDIIVGFPGETDSDFEESEDLLKAVRFQQAYIFKYSEREGTRAAGQMEDTVPDEVKKRRNQRLLRVQEDIQLRRHTACIGRKMDVLVEGPSMKDREKYFGRTDTNLRVVFTPSGEEPGDSVPVTIMSVSPLTLFGEKSA